MSDPYSQSESEIRSDLVDARLKLHHEKCRREQAEACLARSERRLVLVIKEACTIINRYWSQNLGNPEAAEAVRRWESIANPRNDG